MAEKLFIGVDKTGGTGDGYVFIGNYIRAQRLTPFYDGVISRIEAYDSSAGSSFKGGFYSNNTSDPGDLLLDFGEFSGVGGTWVSKTLGSPISVDTGTPIWLILNANMSAITRYAEGVGVAQFRSENYALYTPEDPWGGGGSLRTRTYCYAVYGWEPPVISSIDDSSLLHGVTYILSGTDFMESSNPVTVELCNNSDYSMATKKIAQNVISQSDSSISFSCSSVGFGETDGYLFVTTDLGQISNGYYVTIEPSIPEITDISPSSIGNSMNMIIEGSSLSGGGAVVEIGDNSDYLLSNLYVLEIISENDSEIVSRMDNEGAFYGDGWIYITNGFSERSDGYLINVEEPPSPFVFYGELVGYGHQPFGRHCFGGMQTEAKPGFVDSNPSDEETDVSVLFVSVKTSIYCFSSRIQYVRVEISEDGGDYVDAFIDNSFLSPYDGSDSYIDIQQADSQKMTIQIEKTIPWDENIEIMIRVTAIDQFGNEATKELPMVW